MKKTTFLEAITEAQREEMHGPGDVFVLGTGGKTNLYGVEVSDEYGYNAPLSESAFTGMAIGAALAGSHPIVDISHAAFCYVAMNSICNSLAKTSALSGNRAKLPVVIRSCMIYNAGNAAQHSDRPYSYFMNVPGLKIVVPSNVYDMKGLLKTALRADSPTMLFESSQLWAMAQEIPEEEYFVPFGEADVKKEGTDVTIVAVGDNVMKSFMAASVLEKEGISVEIVDPRTLVPLDRDTIYRSVRKTGRLLCVDSACKTCSAASEIIASVMEDCFDSLKTAPARVTTDDVNVPFSKALEKQIYPNKNKIIDAVRTLMADK